MALVLKKKKKKNPPANTGNVGLIPGLERSPGKGNILQYSCLGNPMDRATSWATVHVVSRVRHNLTTNQQQYCTAQRNIVTVL